MVSEIFAVFPEFKYIVNHVDQHLGGKIYHWMLKTLGLDIDVVITYLQMDCTSYFHMYDNCS